MAKELFAQSPSVLLLGDEPSRRTIKKQMFPMPRELPAVRPITVTIHATSSAWAFPQGMCKNWKTCPLPQELNAFNDLPTSVSIKYAYVDDLATMHADGDWQAEEGVPSKGGRLYRELNAKHEQKVNHNNEALYFAPIPTTSE